MPTPQLDKIDPKQSLKDWDRRIAITQTLKPNKYDMTASMQLNNTEGTMIAFLEEIGENWTYTIELTKQCNIHYHAIATVKNTVIGKCSTMNGVILKIEDIKRKYKDTLGYTVIKRCHDTKGWVEYMTKDLTQTAEVLNMTRLFIIRKIDYKNVNHRETFFNNHASGVKQSGKHPRPDFSLISPESNN